MTLRADCSASWTASRTASTRTYYVHFGADHEHTLAATISYANCLRTVGELPEAHSLAAEAVGRYERVFGMRHPLTLAAQVNLAIILRAIGEHRRAYKVDDEALSALRDVLGPRHPYTLCTASNLATDLVLQRVSDRGAPNHWSKTGINHCAYPPLPCPGGGSLQLLRGSRKSIRGGP